MAHALSQDQISNIVNNTVVVLLARPDLFEDWSANLQGLLKQTREKALEDEMLFVAAVLTLLHSPDDTLPTGTVYDYAWDTLLISLSTGIAQPLDQDSGETLDRLLRSVAEAVVTVITQVPNQKDTVQREIGEIRQAARDAEAAELETWLEDLLALLDGAPAVEMGKRHQGVYAAYWDAIIAALKS